jgi:hypothetical protein
MSFRERVLQEHTLTATPATLAEITLAAYMQWVSLTEQAQFNRRWIENAFHYPFWRWTAAMAEAEIYSLGGGTTEFESDSICRPADVADRSVDDGCPSSLTFVL